MKTRSMRRWSRGLGAMFAVVTAGALARADAPADQYQNFNKGDVIILDNFTHLFWQRTAMVAPSFTEAVAACASLQLGGKSPWRLPSYKELSTLVDESPHFEYPAGIPQPIAIDGNAFPLTAVDHQYWSSSASPASTGTVLAIDFATGAGTTLSQTATGYARCVTP
jgi:hypothetical protein